MKRDVLERPFDRALIKSRQGSFGRELAYVEARHYIERLNEAFDSAWSFEIAAHEVMFDTQEVLVLGRLTADGVTKQAFGGSQVTKNRTTGEVLSLADDLKSAATDALKKAASLFGIGLHLYGDDLTDSPAVPPPRPNQPANGSGHRGSNGAGSNGNGNGSNGNGNGGAITGGGNGQDGARLTSRQLSTIWGIARERQIVEREMRRHCLESYGKQPEFLSKTEASALISKLQAATAR